LENFDGIWIRLNSNHSNGFDLLPALYCGGPCVNACLPSPNGHAPMCTRRSIASRDPTPSFFPPCVKPRAGHPLLPPTGYKRALSAAVMPLPPPTLPSFLPADELVRHPSPPFPRVRAQGWRTTGVASFEASIAAVAATSVSSPPCTSHLQSSCRSPLPSPPCVIGLPGGHHHSSALPCHLRTPSRCHTSSPQCHAAQGVCPPPCHYARWLASSLAMLSPSTSSAERPSVSRTGLRHRAAVVHGDDTVTPRHAPVGMG
jgi:hypothetical protein